MMGNDGIISSGYDRHLYGEFFGGWMEDLLYNLWLRVSVRWPDFLCCELSHDLQACAMARSWTHMGDVFLSLQAGSRQWPISRVSFSCWDDRYHHMTFYV